MKISKDEARILAAALHAFKFEVQYARDNKLIFESMEKLEMRLDQFGKDKRRTGRTSQNGWGDLLKRYSKS
jgi:hypothetical protein